MTGYTRRSPADKDIQTVAITSVDLYGKIAGGLTRQRTTITIDFSYPVGGLHITPALGEQWYVERYQGAWRLKDRIPFNDETTNIDITEGTVKVGSMRGPVELVGTGINLHGPLQVFSSSTSSRPESVSVGAMIFDTTLGQPIWYDGSVWKDASGSPV